MNKMTDEEIQQAFLNAPPMSEIDIKNREEELGRPLTEEEKKEIREHWEFIFRAVSLSPPQSRL